MAEEKEKFLNRWSRRKQEQATEAAAPVEKKLEEKQEPMPVLPPLEQLKPDSDFTPFMDPRIDKSTRREALKKMFADAHFKQADPFEPYSRDFNEDPIPQAMLKTLDHARRLLFDEKKEQAQELATEQTKDPTKETVEKPLPESKDVAGKQDA